MKMDTNESGQPQKRWNFGAMAVSDYNMYQKLVGKKIDCMARGCMSALNYVLYDEDNDEWILARDVEESSIS